MNIFMDIIQPRGELLDDLEKTSNVIYNNTNRIIIIIGIIIILMVLFSVGFIKMKNKNDKNI